MHTIMNVTPKIQTETVPMAIPTICSFLTPAVENIFSSLWRLISVLTELCKGFAGCLWLLYPWKKKKNQKTV